MEVFEQFFCGCTVYSTLHCSKCLYSTHCDSLQVWLGLTIEANLYIIYYNIAGNFRGRKCSQINFYTIHESFLLEILSMPHPPYTNDLAFRESFLHEIFFLLIRKSFLPRIFPAIL